MGFRVSMTEDATRDLEKIHRYVVERHSHATASRLLDRIEDVVRSLSLNPDRGAHPDELLSLGIREYRQVFFKPYRIIYRTIGDTVFIYLIADGRRDMQALLARRLLGA